MGQFRGIVRPKRGDGMRPAGWLLLTISLLVLTVIGVYLTGNEVIGAIGTGTLILTVWFTLNSTEKDNKDS